MCAPPAHEGVKSYIFTVAKVAKFYESEKGRRYVGVKSDTSRSVNGIVPC